MPLWQKRGFLATPPQLADGFAFVAFRDGQLRKWYLDTGAALLDPTLWCQRRQIQQVMLPSSEYRGILQTPLTYFNSSIYTLSGTPHSSPFQ